MQIGFSINNNLPIVSSLWQIKRFITIRKQAAAEEVKRVCVISGFYIIQCQCVSICYNCIARACCKVKRNIFKNYIRSKNYAASSE